ncbi:MAG TPA: SRPBCC domain-containing protein [Candidatus Limnocylindrales bacterium]|nr:SRPBCC domain-containing protein [Candidatus Limnocylindrales bacterium]
MSDVRIDVDLAYPADVVWRALTERSLMNEWFIPTDLAPVAGAVYRAFPPTGLAGFTGPFDVEILEVVEHERMRMRWRGDQLHSEVVWELSDGDPGVSLLVVQSGFLGRSGDQQRIELTATYESLFGEKLPEVLATIAEPLTKKPPKISGADGGQPWWRRLTQIPTARRGGMLSIAGAMVITGLVASALAVVVLGPPSASVGISAGPFAQSGVQPGVTTSPSSTGPALPRRSRPAEAADGSGAYAEYRTAERFQLGYIGSITIKAGVAPIHGWSAVVDLPNKATVTSAWDQVGFMQEHRRVTFTPAAPKRDITVGAQVTFFFQVGDRTESGMPQRCAVNDLPCDGLGE